MASLFTRYRSNANGGLSKDKKKEKEEPPVELTPLEKMLQNVGPVKPHDTAKFFGLENFGNTCYCNSIVQALFYSEVFRDLVVNYPQPLSDSTPKLDITIRPPSITALPPVTKKNVTPPNPTGISLRPEDRPDAPEYKKKQAMMKGPILELIRENLATAEMEECTFTGLKDIFLALLQSQSRTGVLSPQRFLELFKRENEMFRNSMHQDAHEFYGLVLNDIISNLEAYERATTDSKVGLTAPSSPETSLVRDIFEGLLSSETKCLTCETVSKKDETFLDLSIDLEEHSSVTSCLSKFSEEEVLCERNKFQCDRCGGLQEAEKRMKIERLPKILALHLKRFKYTEDFTRLQKLQHRVAYPSHLRLFNTTPNTQDPDRVYELYAVVVHIGGNVYHGHYVSVIKTTDHGWLLFDDEMVEPVDDNYVNNFFGEPSGLATAYVLFYRETTYEAAKALDEDNSFCGSVASSDAAVEVEADAEAPSTPNGRSMTQTAYNSEPTPGIAFSQTLPNVLNSVESGGSGSHPASSSATHLPPVIEDKKAEKKRLKEEKKAEKQEAREEKERRKHEHDSADDKHRKTSNNNLSTSFLERASWSGKSMSRRSLAFLTSKKKDERNGSVSHDGEGSNSGMNGYPAPPSTSGTTSTTATNEVNGAGAHIPSSVSEPDSATSTPVATSSPIPVPVANGVTNGNAAGQSPSQAPGAPEGSSNNSQGQVGDSSQSPSQYPEQKKDKDKEKDGKEGKKSWFGFGLGKKKSTSAFS